MVLHQGTRLVCQSGKGQEYLDALESFDKYFGEFIDEFKRKGWDKYMDIVVIGDHGFIYERGKLWYGYHIDEEVAWIPCMIYSSGKHKLDNRLCDTTDVNSYGARYVRRKRKDHA